MSGEYKTDLGGAKMEPLTHKAFVEFIDHLFAERHKPFPPPTHKIDYQLLLKHGIGFCIDGDITFFSVDGLRRAKEVGAVRPIDSDGA